MGKRQNKHKLQGQGMHRAEVYGVCQVCGCTDDRACIDDNGIPCTWVDETHTLCTACV